MTKVKVYKGRSNRGCVLILLLLFVVCIGPFLCMGGVLAAAMAGVFGQAEVLNATYNEPKAGVEAANVAINIGVGSLQLSALDDSRDLFTANIAYVGGLDYDVEGEGRKRITLRQTQGDYDFLGVLSTLNININPTDEENQLLWTINLSPDVPLELNVESGVGGFELDLSDLQIIDLQLETGVGDSMVTLPTPTESYRVTMNGGVGATTIVLPEGVAVRIEADQGVGDINVASTLEQISRSDDGRGPADGGVWETADFNNTDVRITIIYDGGVGDLTVR